MKNPATFRRSAAAIGLVTTAILMLISTTLSPPFPGDFEQLLAEIDAAGNAATVSALGFTLAQLPFIVGMLGVGHLLRNGAPVLSNVGTTLAVVGAFGHCVYGGVSMVQLTMASDEANRAVHAATLTQLESGPVVAFMAMGLIGTVLGIMLLAIGLWRAHAGPRWVAPALGAFLVIEFAGSAISEWSSHVSGVFYLAALTGLAVAIWRSSLESWSMRTDAGASTATTGRRDAMSASGSRDSRRG